MKLRKKTGMDFFSDNSPKHAVTSLPGRLRHSRSRLQIEGSFACLGTIPNMIKAVFVDQGFTYNVRDRSRAP